MRSFRVDLADLADAFASGNAEATFYQEYLSLLARTGRLEAIKRGRIWYTTERALATYRLSVTTS
jgi:hypothetical protein